MRESKRSPRAALMFLFAALLTMTALAGAAHAQYVTPNSPPKVSLRVVKQYTIEQFMDTTRIGGASFSSDERQLLFHSNKTGIFNVYTAPVAGGEAKQLTTSTK